MSVAPRSAKARRFWGDDDSATPILHMDMDAFFVEAELLKRPELHGKPVIVGGKSQRGVVSSASYEARQFGVHAGMPMTQATRLCPTATLIPPSKGYYGKLSAQVMEILRTFTPVIEQISVDEAFLDVSGAKRRLGNPVHIATLIRQQIRKELSLPASVGIASTKLVAKIASSHAKPDGILLIPHDRTTDFLWELPVGAMWGVGKKTREVLFRRGIQTIGDLAKTPEGDLIRLLGQAAGRHLHDLANGHDPRPVGNTTKEKSIGTETTFEYDIHERQKIKEVMLDQSHHNAYRLRAGGWKASTIAIKVRAADFTTATRSRTLSAPTDVAADIVEVAHQLFDSLPMPAGGIRLVGVRVENLTAAADGYQVLLDDDPSIRQREELMDSIKNKFGMDSVIPGTLARPERHNMDE